MGIKHKHRRLSDEVLPNEEIGQRRLTFPRLSNNNHIDIWLLLESRGKVSLLWPISSLGRTSSERRRCLCLIPMTSSIRLNWPVSSWELFRMSSTRLMVSPRASIRSKFLQG